MHVLIVGYGFGINEADRAPHVDFIAAIPITFRDNIDAMADRWGGGVAVAKIVPDERDEQTYRVIDFWPLPVEYRQDSDVSFVLEDVHRSWFMRFDRESEKLNLTQAGAIPSPDDPTYAPLWAFIRSP